MLENINFPSDLRKLPTHLLGQVCTELREELIEQVSKTGGHLGAGLGVVELTVALHYIFNTPDDILIWDVGHQSYPHKILTGRKNKMPSLRQKDGISGFTKRKESEYDPFGAGHSSTSISAATGFARASLLANKKNKIVAVIGDGAMSAGMAYEALNNCKTLNNLIIVLNDNEMSIAPPAGALSSYLTKLTSSSSYSNLREQAKGVLDRLPKIVKSTVKNVEQGAKNIVNQAITGSNLFENLGINYFGPIDGHNINELTNILDNIKNNPQTSPILLHINTKKGHGYSFAEKANDKFHGVAKFDIKTGTQNKKTGKASYTDIFASSLIKKANHDDKIVAITAAMPCGTGLNKFKEIFPDRCFDVGIAEQHAVTFAGGLAASGFKPFVAIYSTFLQRAYDQIVHDIAIQNLPVKFAIDRGGLVGADGATHAGSFDLTYLASLPNMVVMAPSDSRELEKMVDFATEYNDSPIALRYPRGEASLLAEDDIRKINLGKSRTIQIGSEILILSLGTVLKEVIESIKLLDDEKKITLIDMRFCKPIDKDIIDKYAQKHRKLITIEENAIGGFSSQVNHYLNEQGYNKNLEIKNVFLPDIFQDQASPEEMKDDAGLSVQKIFNLISE